MPFDLAAVERGYGECDVEWEGQTITLRYRADLNNRALIAMKRAVVGVELLSGGGRFPDVEAMIDELLRVLLPIDHEYGPGWDVVHHGEPVPITFDTIVDLKPGLPASMLGAIFRDLGVDNPNRRRPSRRSSPPGADSAPTESPTTTPSSTTPNGQASLPGPSPATPTPVASGLAGGSGFE